MKNQSQHNERVRLETYLMDRQTDFLATYMLVRDIHTLILNNPEQMTPKTIAAAIMISDKFSRHPVPN